MYKILFIASLLATAVSVASDELEEGSEYKNWCRNIALADRISAAEQDDFIRKCIDKLVSADKRPDSARDRRKERDDNDD